MDESEVRFEAYADGLAEVLGHGDRTGPMKAYCAGLMLPLERKSMEPLAAATDPARVSAQHQSLMHFVTQSPWSDVAMLSKVRELTLPVIERHGPIEAWIIDDTSFPKQGRHSVGVAHQYCGQLGKPANCQVAVSLSIANAWASLPVGYRLYLPKAWAEDPVRRRKARVPEEIVFETKPQIALDLICSALDAGLPRGVVLWDGAYGMNTETRVELAALGLSYVSAVPFKFLAWRPGFTPEPGRKRTKTPREDPNLISLRDIALGLPADAWRTLAWREGSCGALASRFASLSLQTAPEAALAPPVEQLLVEWPEGEAEPTGYWLSNLPEDTPLQRLVEIAKLRWRIERDYEDLKQELGLGHFEGRGWRGFHHHASLCIAAYGFLISERETIPPSGPGSSAAGQKAGLPEGYRPRGAADPDRETHPELHRHAASAPRRRPHPTTAEVSMLQTETELVTQ